MFGIPFEGISRVLPYVFCCMSVLPIVFIAFFLSRTRSFDGRTKILYLVTLFLESFTIPIRFLIGIFLVPFIAIPFLFLVNIPLSMVASLFFLLGNRVSVVVVLAYYGFMLLVNTVTVGIVGLIFLFLFSWGPPVMSFLYLMGIPPRLFLTIRSRLW